MLKGKLLRVLRELIHGYILIGALYCNNDDEKFENYRKKTSLARERIREFKFLNEIFDSFNDYEELIIKKKISQNVIFNLLISENYKGTHVQENLRNSPSPYSTLSMLEEAMKHFFMDNKTSRREVYNKFISDLKSINNSTSMAAFFEIKIAYELFKNSKSKNVNIYHKTSTNKNPDISIRVAGKDTIIELTGLYPRMSETKIRSITKAVSNYFLSKCKGKTFYVAVLMDTIKFKKDNNNNIDLENSVAYLDSYIDRLQLDKLVGFNGEINFEEKYIQIYSKNTSRASKSTKKLFFDKILKDATETLYSNLNSSKRNKDIEAVIDKDSILAKWLKQVLLNDFIYSPFDVIYFSDKGTNGCIMINSIENNTSDLEHSDTFDYETSRLVKAAFINQLKNSISKNKLTEKQYERNHPFIIAVRAHEWRYEYESDYEDFSTIRNHILSILKDKSEVSGLLLFTDDLFSGKYIENPYAKKEIKLTASDLISAGILNQLVEPQITYDRKIDFSKLNYIEKTSRLKQILSLEEQFNLQNDTVFTPYSRRDIIEMLENIRLFLEDKPTDEELLKKIKLVIEKYCAHTDYVEDTYDSSMDTDEFSTVIHDEPLKAYAASCLILLNYQEPSTEYVSHIEKLSKDIDSHVRAFICKDLPYLYEKYPNEAMNIANRYIKDNKIVRFFLQNFIYYLYKKDRKKALSFYKRIIQRYGFKNEQSSKRLNLFRVIIPLITETALLTNDKKYEEILIDIITNASYNSLIKEEVIFDLRKEKLILNKEIADKILAHYESIINSSKDLTAKVDFFLLYNLIKLNVSLFPKIGRILDIISNTSFPVTPNYDHTYHFEILSYIKKFHKEFPNEAVHCLNNILKHNPELHKSFYSFKYLDAIKSIIYENKDLIKENKPLLTELKGILNKLEDTPHFNKKEISNFIDN